MVKLWQLSLLVCLIFVISCGGSGSSTGGGGFAYGGKYYGTWGGPGGPPHGSDFNIKLDSNGDIDSAKSYSGWNTKCSISGSVRKVGNELDLMVRMTVGDGSCTNNVLTANCRLVFVSETGRWTGVTTGTFSDPFSVRQIGFTLKRDESW